MEQRKCCQITTWLFVSILLLSSLIVESFLTNDIESLEYLLRKQVNKEIKSPKTGDFYDISIPSNYTGIKARVVRLRTSSFYVRGVNYSLVKIPPRVVPQPNRKRMTIIYENLGNWSSHFYNVPNYTMVAPVFGLVAYTSSGDTFTDDEKMNFFVQENPILINFQHVSLHIEKNVTPICVSFNNGGIATFNMTKRYVCEAYGTGHYTLVISNEIYNKTQSERINLWWVLGFVIGFVGLVILILVLVNLVKAAKRRRIKKLEKNSENGEPFDTFWIGDTKLPLATMVRTQPSLENN